VSFFFIDDDQSGPSSVSFVSSTTSTASTITCPTVSPYDVGILWDVAGNSGGIPSTVVPSGWTSIANASVDAGSYEVRSILSYRIFDGSEDGSTITGMSSAGHAKVLLLFRPAAGSVVSALALQSPWGSQALDGDITPQTISASGQSAPLVRIGAASRVGSSTSLTLSGTFDAAVITVTGTNTRANIGYAVQNSAPSDDTIDDNLVGGAHSVVSGWIRFL